MAAIAIRKSKLIVTCGMSVITVDLENEEFNILYPPNIVGQNAEKDEKSQKNKIITTLAHVVHAAFSPMGEFLVLCSMNNQLSLWKTDDWCMISNRKLVRAASKVKFTPTGKAIIVGDKSGDAYMYSVDSPHQSGSLLLGHLSMLLDILVTPCEQFMITCDRDEKIRVSRFPQGYQIESFCLGHEEFVTCIHLLPHNSSILISSSGDGTLRFWNYINGKQVHIIDSNDDATIHPEFNHSYGKACNKINSQCKANNESEEIIPVKCFSTYKRDEHSSVICACFSNFPACLVYQVVGDGFNITVHFVQLLKFQVEPWDIVLTETGLLWTLSPIDDKPVTIYVIDNATNKFQSKPEELSKNISGVMSALNRKSDMFKNISAPQDLSILYKRKFDNIKQYHEKKRKRLENTSTTATCSNIENC